MYLHEPEAFPSLQGFFHTGVFALVRWVEWRPRPPTSSPQLQVRKKGGKGHYGNQLTLEQV